MTFGYNRAIVAVFCLRIFTIVVQHLFAGSFPVAIIRACSSLLQPSSTVSLPLTQTLNNRKKRLVELIENWQTSARSLLLLEINSPMTGATRRCLHIKGRSMFGNWFTSTFLAMMSISVILKCFLWFALQSIRKSMLVIPP